MFDDLRALVRADSDRQVLRVRVDMRWSRITQEEGRDQIDAIKAAETVLLDGIDDAEELAAE